MTARERGPDDPRSDDGIVDRLWCDGCARRSWFVRPPCPDGHGPDCPELVCTRCGGAVLVDSYDQLGAADEPAAPAGGSAGHAA